MKLRKWDTLLELKEDHNVLGLKGWIFFIVDFPRDIESDGNVLNYVIAQPVVTGNGLSAGTATFVLNKKGIDELFIALDKNLEELTKELLVVMTNPEDTQVKIFHKKEYK